MRVELQIVVKDSEVLDGALDVYIGTSDSSGIKYVCDKTKGSVMDAIMEYLGYNLELEE